MKLLQTLNINDFVANSRNEETRHKSIHKNKMEKYLKNCTIVNIKNK